TSKRIRAATYGRGLWEADGYGATTSNYASTPIFTYADENPKNRIRGSFNMEVGFYKNLDHVDVTGFNISQIICQNGVLTAFSGGPLDYSFTVQPTNPGIVTLYIPPAVVADADGIANLESAFFEVYYVSDPPELSYQGPGGVGTLDQLAIWIDPAVGLLKPDGNKPSVTGDTLSDWFDQSNHNITIEQNLMTRPPYFLKS